MLRIQWQYHHRVTAASRVYFHVREETAAAFLLLCVKFFKIKDILFLLIPQFLCNWGAILMS